MKEFDSSVSMTSESIHTEEGSLVDDFIKRRAGKYKNYKDYRGSGRAQVHKHARRNRTSRHLVPPIEVGCRAPSRTVTIDYSGRCFVCSCPAWVPYPVENILNFKSFEEIWADPVAKKIQESTRPGGSFKFCNTLTCGVEDTSTYEFTFDKRFPDDSPVRNIKADGPGGYFGFITPENVDYINCYQINIAIDDSCNLQCATCRPAMIHHNNKGPKFEYKKRMIEHICKLLDSFDHHAIILIGGDGEIFSSKVYSDMIYNYKPNPLHKFMLKTNGTLVSSRIKDSQIMNQLEKFSISIDAGSKEVYERVRRPGKWKALMDSLDVLFNLSALPGTLSVYSFNFVLHYENMNDLPNFVDLCEKYNSTGTVQAIQNWGTYGSHPSPPEFLKQRVHVKGSEHYSEWQEIAHKVMAHPYYSCIRLENELLSQL